MIMKRVNLLQMDVDGGNEGFKMTHCQETPFEELRGRQTLTSLNSSFHHRT